jgi:hypothetical protein
MTEMEYKNELNILSIEIDHAFETLGWFAHP